MTKRNDKRRSAKNEEQALSKGQAPQEPRHMPVWLRRAACFFGALFCVFGVVYCVMVLLVGKGSPDFIVAIIVFAAMAVHLVRSGLGDGRWRAER